MSGRQSAAMDRALALIGQPRGNGEVHTAYSAARAEQVSLSGIYKAVTRIRATKRKKHA